MPSPGLGYVIFPQLYLSALIMVQMPAQKHTHTNTYTTPHKHTNNTHTHTHTHTHTPTHPSQFYTECSDFSPCDMQIRQGQMSRSSWAPSSKSPHLRLSPLLFLPVLAHVLPHSLTH